MSAQAPVNLAEGMMSNKELAALELQVLLAIEQGDFEAFKDGVRGLDHEEVIRLEDPSTGNAQWDMTLRQQYTPARLSAFMLLATTNPFLDGHEAMVRFMVHRGQDVDVCKCGMLTGSPLVDALYKGSTRMVELLLELGAHPNQMTEEDRDFDEDFTPWVPLHTLLAHGQSNLQDTAAKLELMLAAGASLEAVATDARQTPLVIAAGSGRWPPVLALLEIGEDPHARFTPSSINAMERALEVSSDLYAQMCAWVAAKAIRDIDEVASTSIPESGHVAEKTSEKSSGARP